MSINQQQRTAVFEKLTISVSEASPLPIYHQIRDELRTYITDSRVPEGCMLPDLRSLSTIAGVSPRTMDRALQELIGEGVCFRRPKKGTFVASSVKGSQRRAVCAVYCARGWSTLENDSNKLPMYRGIETACRERGMDVVLINSDVGGSLASYGRSTDLDLKGAILLSYDGLDEINGLASRFPGTRFICLNYQVPGFEETPGNVHGLFNDEFAGGYQVGDYLGRRGHTSLVACTLGPMTDENYARRVRGYQQALRDHDLTSQAEHVFVLPIEGSRDQEYLARTSAPDILGLQPEPTAVFCVNDWLAQGIIQHLTATGTEEDVEVFGYDKVESRYERDSRFNTVVVDFVSMGRKAVDLVSDDRLARPKVLRITPEIVIRTQWLHHDKHTSG